MTKTTYTDAETGLSTRIVVGLSDNTEAEYGFRADDAASMLILVDEEIISVEGYSTLNLAILAARKEGCPMEVL